MKRSKLHKIWRGQNLGPIKRILAHDQVGLKIFYPKHANVAIRASGCTPAEAHKVNPDDKDVIISASNFNKTLNSTSFPIVINTCCTIY